MRSAVLGDLVRTPTYSAPAEVVANNRPMLASQIDARVEQITVSVGDQVAAGDVLARLDCRRYSALLASAEAATTRAEAQQRFASRQLARARDLKKNKSISDELLDQRRNELAIADAEVLRNRESQRLAALDVDNCAIRAPVSGYVTSRHASSGDYLMRGAAIISLIDTSDIEVSADLRNAQVDDVQTAADLVFENRRQRHPVRLRTLLPLADAVSRTREARFSFAGEPALPGSAGRIVWQGDTPLLPADYLVRRGSELGIFTLVDERARFVPIAGAEEGRPALVGLPADTRLITAGRQRLNDGDRVQVQADGNSDQ